MYSNNLSNNDWRDVLTFTLVIYTPLSTYHTTWWINILRNLTWFTTLFKPFDIITTLYNLDDLLYERDVTQAIRKRHLSYFPFRYFFFPFSLLILKWTVKRMFEVMRNYNKNVKLHKTLWFITKPHFPEQIVITKPRFSLVRKILHLTRIFAFIDISQETCKHNLSLIMDIKVKHDLSYIISSQHNHVNCMQ